MYVCVLSNAVFMRLLSSQHFASYTAPLSSLPPSPGINEMRKYVELEQSCPNCRAPFADQNAQAFDEGARGYVQVERRRSRQGLRWE